VAFRPLPPAILLGPGPERLVVFWELGPQIVIFDPLTLTPLVRLDYGESKKVRVCSRPYFRHPTESLAWSRGAPM
jgi:hypothetical protein